jgi:multisubunit Na+/H+ antiporter MnhC subunit
MTKSLAFAIGCYVLTNRKTRKLLIAVSFFRYIEDLT